jgi:rRNA maturation endonuclease Nob1
MSKKWNTNQFCDYISENHSDFELRSEYFGNNKKVILFHKKCHREFEVYASNFKRRGTCPLCYGKTKRTTKNLKN